MPTEIYTLSLHDALPIFELDPDTGVIEVVKYVSVNDFGTVINPLIVEGQLHGGRSEEHTSELQSHSDLVCRLLLERKKKPTLLTMICNSITEATITRHTQ